MDNKHLQQLVEEISLKYFKRPFLHKAEFNHRLRTTGGRYILRTGNIEINKKYYDVFGKQELIGIIKHELCHYHLHQNRMGYQHKDRDFKELAQKVGAPRYCKTLPDQEKSRRRQYIYECTNCRQPFLRRRRVDVKRYVCGKCGGHLREVQKLGS